MTFTMKNWGDQQPVFGSQVLTSGQLKRVAAVGSIVFVKGGNLWREAQR